MTRAIARTRLARRLGNRTDFTTTAGGDADTYLDAGLLDLCTRRGVEINELRGTAEPITTQAGSSAIPRPPGVFALRYLDDPGNARVYQRFNGGMFEFLRAKQNATQDVPYQFIEDGSVVYLYPVPSGPFLLVPYVYNYPTWETDAGAVPSIDAGWHEGALIVAAELAFRDYGDSESAVAAGQEFMEWLGNRDTAFKRSQRAETPLRGVQPHRDIARWPARGR